MAHSFLSLPPLETLRTFDAAARTGSFSAAAGLLGLTHGAVSRQIAKLEHWLGQRLFERQARGVALTEDGRRLFMTTSEALALIAGNADRWQRARGSSVVRITALPSVSALWLIPRLRALEAGEPRLRIELQIDTALVELEADGTDLAMRCGRGTVPGRVSIQLFEERCHPIAAPDLAASLGRGAPERLLGHPLLHDSDATGWRGWFAACGLDYRPGPQDRRFEDYTLVLNACAHGLGIALARPPLAQEMLRSGRVVMVDERTSLNPYAYWLDRPPGQPRPAAAALARRITAEAGVGAETAERFLGTA
jgi:DNA-binding transcriptional LysR family regulator